MIIKIEPPPIYEQALKVFGELARNAIFSWGEVIYNPSGLSISSALIAHEEVHGQRQGIHEAGIFSWWLKYLSFASFRLAEEIPAHQAEYEHYCTERRRTRNQRRFYLKTIAQRLSGPLYGNLITFDKAVELIRGKE